MMSYHSALIALSADIEYCLSSAILTEFERRKGVIEGLCMTEENACHHCQYIHTSIALFNSIMKLEINSICTKQNNNEKGVLQDCMRQKTVSGLLLNDCVDVERDV